MIDTGDYRMIVLSAIIPMYKGKEYIQASVSEILKIDCIKEILVIDDGSPDDSYEYAKKQFEGTEEVRVYKKDNGGIAEARNYGLKEAKGKYVLFVDQDDRVNPKTISQAIMEMEKSDLAAVMWTTMFEYNDGTSKICDEVTNIEEANREDIIKTVIPSMLSRESSRFTTYPGHIWGGIYRHSIIEHYDLRLKRFIDYEDDLLFVFDFLLVAEKILFLPDVGYFWKTNPQSYSHAFKYVERYIDKAEKFRDYLKNEYRTKTGYNLEKSIVDFFDHYTIIGAIKNACGVGNKGNEDTKEIIDKIRSPRYKNAFRQRNEHMHDKREQLSYKLIKIGLDRETLFIARQYYKLRNKGI